MAKLKAVIAKLDEVPEGLRELYTKVGDEYVLDLDDKDFTKKLSEFRDNNIQLRKKQEEAQKQLDRFKDVDPEKYAKALEAMQKLELLEQENLAKAGNFEELFDKRTAALRKDYETRLLAARTRHVAPPTNEPRRRVLRHFRSVDYPVAVPISDGLACPKRVDAI